MGLLFKGEKEEEEQRSRCHLLWLHETGNDEHVIIDPMDNERKLQIIDLPQLINFPFIQCLASNHGWLLMLSREDTTLFFYNPFTQAKVDLPYRRSLFEAAAFTAPPTSPDCVIYGVACYEGCVNIGVLRMGEEKKPMWRNYRIRRPGEFAAVRAVVASTSSGADGDGGNNKLWCVDCLGRVGVFEIEGGVWRVVCGVKSEKVRSVGVGGVVEVGGELVVGVRRKGAGKRGLGELYVLKENKSGGGGEMGWEKIDGGELGGGGVYLGGIGGGVVEDGIGGVGEVFFADDFGGWCCVYGKESTDTSHLKWKLQLGNPSLGLKYTPVWIHKSA
ncbi:hypothetical protein Sjap_006737 [Stephania japonica]|uniref:KIB1-4 beta-propeller domain-containing protein n=1 Tax=Stephania japonica TaxID=461633 RepID=A0AAP0K7Y8_9MAGN